MNNTKFQNLVIFSFKTRMKHKFSLSINQIYTMKKSKHRQYFHCFIVCILGPYLFLLSFQQNIVTILVGVIFTVPALIRVEALIRGRRLFQCRYLKVRCLFAARCLLEEKRHARIYLCYCMKERKAKLKFLHSFYI